MKCIIEYLSKLFFRKNNKNKKTWKDVETYEHPPVIDLYKRYPDLKD